MNSRILENNLPLFFLCMENHIDTSNSFCYKNLLNYITCTTVIIIDNIRFNIGEVEVYNFRIGCHGVLLRQNLYSENVSTNVILPLPLYPELDSLRQKP